MYIGERGVLVFLTYMPLFFIVSAVLLVAHLTWIIQVARRDWRADRPLPVRTAHILIATVTPLVGFYVAKFLAIPPAPVDRASTRGRLLMPVCALIFIILATLVLQSHQGPYEQQSLWSGGWRGLAGMFAATTVLYVAQLAILYMCAQVFGLSRHSPWISGVHIAVILLFTAFMLPAVWPL